MSKERKASGFSKASGKLMFSTLLLYADDVLIKIVSITSFSTKKKSVLSTNNSYLTKINRINHEGLSRSNIARQYGKFGTA